MGWDVVLICLLLGHIFFFDNGSQLLKSKSSSGDYNKSMVTLHPTLGLRTYCVLYHYSQLQVLQLLRCYSIVFSFFYPPKYKLCPKIKDSQTLSLLEVQLIKHRNFAIWTQILEKF